MTVYAGMLRIIDEYEMRESFHGFSFHPILPFRIIRRISLAKQRAIVFKNETISTSKLILEKI